MLTSRHCAESGHWNGFRARVDGIRRGAESGRQKGPAGAPIVRNTRWVAESRLPEQCGVDPDRGGRLAMPASIAGMHRLLGRSCGTADDTISLRPLEGVLHSKGRCRDLHPQ